MNGKNYLANDYNYMSKEELKQQSKVVDMMLTMHSILANQYLRKAQILEISMLAISTVLVASTFIDSQTLLHFSLSKENAHIIFGLCSILVFLLSIVSLVVNWKGKSRQHREAFNALISLKSEWKEVLSYYDKFDEQNLKEFTRKSSLIISNLIPIPDNRFNQLKARHYKKVKLSKMISAHPGSSILLLRILIFFRSSKKAIKDNLPE